MTKQQTELVITGGLILALIVISLITLKPRKKPPAPQPITPVPAAAPAVAARPAAPAAPAGAPGAPKPIPNAAPAQSVEATPKEQEEQKKRSEAPWGLDPFYHTASDTNIAPTNLALKGISIGRNQKRFVFINNDIFTVGDVIPGGYKVMEIEKNRVLLRRGSERFYVPMPEE